MYNSKIARDLTKNAPHSPRDRVAGFVILRRAVDKCRAQQAGTLGGYEQDDEMDNQLFRFKGITGAQFSAGVAATKNYEDVGDWLLANGTVKTPMEIKAWSDEMEAASPRKKTKKRALFEERCVKLGLNPETATLFDRLEAEDRESFGRRLS
jgi:hypothetical protein